MSVAPVACVVEVRSAPSRTFDLFTASMGAWWPRGQTPGDKPHADLVIEPRVGGRWFERDADGKETQWGKVLAWEPARRLVLGWQLNSRFQFDASVLMEVEIQFLPLSAGGTRVSLEHRGIEQLGTDAPSFASKVNQGWPARMGEFAAHVAAVA